MIHLSTSITYYKRPDVQQALVDHAQDKEIGVRYNDRFGKRPDVLRYPGDILAHALKGASSFHCSEELWRNPLQLHAEMSKEDMVRLRKGWDLILDIDCAIFEYSRIAAELVTSALKAHGIKDIGVKFSGNKGFHIGVPFVAFPENVSGEQIATQFPEGARRVAGYIRELIKDPLKLKILDFEKGDFSAIVKKTGKSQAELEWDAKGVESFLVIDTILISPRHLYRMPYSLHEKSGLVSVPIEMTDVSTFVRDQAKPELVKTDKSFLIREPSEQATSLFIESYDFSAKTAPPAEEKREYEIPEEAIPETCFPDCIKKILSGLEDGRKRGVFILINFLTSVGWDAASVEQKVREWNKNNKEPLREVYLVSQLRYAKQHKVMLPPNCNNEAYYKDLAVKCKESVCSRCHNPVFFARRMQENLKDNSKKSEKVPNKQEKAK